MSNLVFATLFPLVISLSMILPTVFFSISSINKKLFFICFFINFLCIISLQLNMKDILCMVILFLTSFIYLYFTYKNVVYSIVIIVLINIVISLGDHITGFLFTNVMKISFSQIEESKLFYLIFAFLTLLISCLINRVLGMSFFKLKKFCLSHNKTKKK